VPAVGFTPEDVCWTEDALSKHYRVPIQLYDPAEFAERFGETETTK
jgi:hypothetical protein